MNRSYNMIIIKNWWHHFKNWWHHFIEAGCLWLEQWVLPFILRSLASTHLYPAVLCTNSLPILTWWLAPSHRLRPKSFPSGPSWWVLSFTSWLMSLLLCRNFCFAAWITSSVRLPHLSSCILCQFLVCTQLSLKNIYIFLVTKAVLFN